MYHGSQEHSLSLVRPVLEYASPAWDPTSSESICKLEKVQRQTDRFVYGNYSDRNPRCVIRMVIDLGWETLESTRKNDRLTTLYKIWHGSVDMDTVDHVDVRDMFHVYLKKITALYLYI